MDLKSKHSVETNFSMSSMTDIVFLLLIFFMLTASFVTPSGLPVSLPSSKNSNIVLQKVSVTITKDGKFYVDERLVEKSELGGVLRKNIGGKKGIVVLHCDKSVAVEELVAVASIATGLNAKVSIATKPEK